MHKLHTMKRIALILTMVFASAHTYAQHTVEIRNMWDEPTKVHVNFGEYTIAFSIADIKKALSLLAETGETSYGDGAFLDTTKSYYIELYPGYNTEYHNRLQPIIQKAVGAYLLTVGRAVIENPKKKKLKGLIVDIQPMPEGENITDVKFYDVNSNKLVFNGQMVMEMYNKDLGIE